ncbi:MAG: hypothetical protein ACFFCO_09000 [Promethearchaeota archaeon]
MNKLARLLSMLLSPPVIALGAVIVFAFYSPIGLGLLVSWQAFLLGLIFVVVGPVLPLSIMVARNKMTFDVKNRGDRPLLYLAAIIVYGLGALLAWFFQNYCIALLAAAYVGVTSAVALTSLFWKVSAHTAGVAGPITALVWVYGLIAVPFFLLACIVGWARWCQALHTVAQLIGGAIIAILVTGSVYWLLWGLPAFL